MRRPYFRGTSGVENCSRSFKFAPADDVKSHVGLERYTYAELIEITMLILNAKETAHRHSCSLMYEIVLRNTSNSHLLTSPLLYRQHSSLL